MDNYSLEEVKNLINNNLITKEVFDNILKSTTRRLELYNDKDDWEILKYLSQSSLVSDDSKEKINKYLKSYDIYCKRSVVTMNNNSKSRRYAIIITIALGIAIILLWAYIMIIKG